jgi:maltose O-acetyltransferase
MDPMTKPASLWQRAVLRLDRHVQRLKADALRRQFASCGANVSLQMPVVINGADHLSVGSGVSINAFVHIWAQGGVTIGDSTLIASHAAITSLTHGTDSARYSESLVSKPVAIGRNVWIGSHAVILPGVTIGDGAIVGAGAVVTRDVAAGDVVAGVPAAPIRTRPA